MTDDVGTVLLVLLEELSGSRECNLVDVLVQLLSCHTNTIVTNSECASIWIDLDIDLEILNITLEVTSACNCLELLRSIYCIADELTEEDLMVGIHEFFNHRENVLGGYIDCTLFCHNFIFLYVLKFKLHFFNCKSYAKDNRTGQFVPLSTIFYIKIWYNR